MKSIVRKTIVALVCLFVANAGVMASTDKPIKVSQLPLAAQQLIKKDFSGKKVALSKMETGLFEKKYDVIFTNGDKVEFDKNGNWTEIECKNTAVPGRLVPSAIRQYVKNNYSSHKIIGIEKDRSEYDVKLTKGVEITFDKNFQVLDIDM